MKRFLRYMAAAAVIGAACGPAMAADVTNYPAGAAAGGIEGTRHNMGSLGKVIRGMETTEVCIFCHTPHHANKGGANGLAPLWNKGTSAPTSFTAYGGTLGGTTIQNTDIGGASLACLSCHDGITTFDNIVNAPGKGGVVDGGADRNWSFAMPVTLGWPSLTISQSFHSFAVGMPCGLCHSADQIQRLLIGTDLSNDHPVSVAYNTDRASLRATNAVIGSIDLTSDLASSAAAAYGANLGQNRWAVKGFISASARISDLLRNGRVECSSCHDPHFDNLSWDEVETTWMNQGSPMISDQATWCGNVGEACSDGNFLRRVGGNTGSGVCRTCHNK